MPQYKVTDPTSGKTLMLTGDSPPTEDELNQVFAQHAATPQPTQQPGMLSQAANWLKPVLQMQGQNLGKIANLSPAQLYGPQQGYVNNMAKNILGMVNPLNAGLAVVAPETLVGRYGQVANAAMRGGVAGLGAEQVGQGLGQRLAGVPLSDEQKTQADLGIALGPLMMLGSAYQAPKVEPSGVPRSAFTDTIGSMIWEKAQKEREAAAKQAPPQEPPVQPTPPLSTAPVSPPAATAPVVSSVSELIKKTTVPTQKPAVAVASYTPEDLALYQNLVAAVKTRPLAEVLPKIEQLKNKYGGQSPQSLESLNENNNKPNGTSSLPNPQGQSAESVPVVEQAKGLAPQNEVQSALKKEIPGADSQAVRLGSGRDVQGSGGEVEQNPLAPSTEVKGTAKLTEQSGRSRSIKTETLLKQVGINPSVGPLPFNRLTRGQLAEKLQIVRMVMRNQLSQNHPDKFMAAGPDVVKAQTEKFKQLLGVKNDLEKRIAYKIANTPEIGGGTTVKGPSSVPKPDKTSGESGFVIAPKEMWDRVFSNKGSKADPGQMWNRLKNVFGEGSAMWTALQAAGLKGFLNSPKSAQEVQDWADSHARGQVQVHTYGMEGKVSEARHRLGELTHILDTSYRGWTTDPNVEARTPEEARYVKEYKELSTQVAKEPKDTSPKATSYYSHVSALDTTQPMPDWTATKSGKNVQRVDVVIPGQKALQDKLATKYGADWSGKDLTPEESKQWKESADKWQPDGLHENLPNTLGWAMIQYKTGPNGEKIAVIVEAQSRWGQEVREAKQKQHATEGRYANVQDHPLLRDYNRLILKAAIKRARKERATHIMVSDYPTAAHTEGWDTQYKGPYTTLEDAEQAASMMRGSTGDNWIVEKPEQTGRKNEWLISPHAGGGRLNYDTILPKIAEELTGNKGEKVSLGEHKNAYDKNYMSEHADQNEPGWTDKQPRSNLIFRNPDGTPKTDVSGRVFSLEAKPLPKEFSLYGKTGSIFPESPAIKAVKESGAVEVQPQLVQDALSKLDSLKSFGGDILSAVTDGDRFKAWMLKRQGYDLPKIEAINPQFANVVAKYANSQVSSVLRAHANITKVLGDKQDNPQFRKQLGGLIYEDMRRASGNIGNPVFKLKNSPFASEQQYQAALKNPEFQKALAAWKEHIQPLATEMHEKLGGGLAESGKETGAFANLIAVLSDERTELEQPQNAPSTIGPLATMKRGSAFSKERKFTGQEYNLDAGDMAFRMLTKNAQQAALRDVYSEGEKAGLLKLLKPGDETPANMVRQPNPVTLRSLIQKDAEGNTEHVNVSRWLAFDKRISPTLKQALQLNTSWKEALKEGAPVLHVASQAIIKTQVSLGIDLGFHTFNDMVAVANSPKGLLALPSKALQIAKAQHDLVSKTPAVQEELAKMAETGVSFRGESLGGWSSHALKVADTVTRLVLNREYDNLVKEGTVKDLPAERRRFINGRAGQYNKRFMTWFQQGMQETGLGSFNVAGRNFNRLAVGNLTMSPGVKAASNVDALRLRLSIAAGVATAALIIPAAVNTMTTGSPRPEGTEFGDIVLHKNKDGRYEVINMRKWTMLDRGARASGVGAVMREQVMPRIRGEQPASLGQTAYDSVKDMGRTAVAPFSGPPLNLLSVGLTGRTEMGLGYEQRTPGEKAPYAQAMLGQLNPLVGPLVQQGQGATAGARVAQRLGSVAGVQASQAPFSIIRNRATQWKQSNNIRTDDASFAPSEYLPLKQALMVDKVDTAKEAYQQLISEKANQHPSLTDDEAKHEAMMDLQKEFSKLENFRFVNKENEVTFKASLSPEQRKMYDMAVQQQKDMANKFFAEIQPKIDNNQPRGFKPPTFRKSKGFSNQF